MTTHPAPQLALIEMQPCPFCGGKPSLFPPTCKKSDKYDPRDRAFPEVRCCAVRVEGKDWDQSGKTAITAWNTRPQSRPEAELPELPEPSIRGLKDYGGDHYTATQMRAYGQQCAATRPAEVGGDGWLPIESAPEDGTPILIAAMEGGQLFDVLHGRFEVLAQDEEDGPWDIRDGEPWCSYEGRSAGTYFCHWLPEKEWESRWKFGPNTGYTHWRHALSTPGSEAGS